jgi:nucleoside-diphosphate-sugar epimerase
LGRALSAALLAGGGEVRVFLDETNSQPEQTASWRAAGFKTARGALDDEAHLESALTQVHTVVHAGGEPLDDPAAVLDVAAGVLSAAIGAGCRRFAWASQLAAAEPRGNPYLEACAQIELLLAEAPLDTVVIRRALTYGPGDPLTAALASGALAWHPEAAAARHRPLFVGDLAAAVAAADRERRGVSDSHVVLGLVGPDPIGLGEFARLLGAPAGASGPRLPSHVADLLARELSDDATRASTPLAEGVAAVNAATSAIGP